MMSASQQPPMPVLAQLLPELTLPESLAALRVSGLQLDSRRVRAGDVFIAVPGSQGDGRDHLGVAATAGASAALIEAWGAEPYLQRAPLPVVPVTDLAAQLSAIAGRYYGEPSVALRLTGITGTNGKTTCAHLLGQLLAGLGEDCGVLGTLGSAVFAGERPGTFAETDLTTPDAIAVQRQLATWRDQGLGAAVMEVSSHSLVQGRVAALQFDTAVFTNLSRDHLDYHSSMSAYAAAKARLFAMPALRWAIVNLDDEFGRQLAAAIGARANGGPQLIGYSLRPERGAELWVEIESSGERGVQARIHSPWGRGLLCSPLYGNFNLSNLLAVVATACVQGFPLGEVLARIPALASVPGRLQRIAPDAEVEVVIDYAHTPDALAQVLTVLRGVCRGALWCVFGCGGDRDRGKRAAMGGVVRGFADHVVVTTDNPRSEAPEAIAEDILQAWSGESEGPCCIADRAAAIHYAIGTAGAGDLVLIAGKGHEEYQLIGERKLPFSDAAQARLALRARGVR